MVRVLLHKAGYPEKIVFPIPFDISYADNPEEAIKIMEVTKLKTKFPEQKQLLFSVPHGARLVNTFPTKEGKLAIEINPQSSQFGHTVVRYGPGGVFERGYPFAIVVPRGSLNRGEVLDIAYGETVLDFKLPAKFSSVYQEFYQKISEPDMIPETNLKVIIHTLVVPIEYVDSTTENLLSVGNSPVFILSNETVGASY